MIQVDVDKIFSVSTGSQSRMLPDISGPNNVDSGTVVEESTDLKKNISL